MHRSSSMTPAQRRAHASYAATVSHVRLDGTFRTAAARATFREQFRAIVDPTGELAPKERDRRAERLRASWFAYLRFHAAMGTKAGPMAEWLAANGYTTPAKAVRRVTR